MADVVYCHQCAKDNRLTRKFCYRCHSPLWLQDLVNDKTRVCRQCNFTNPSFAKFCKRCSTPLVPNPSKKPEPIIPFALNNPHADTGDNCPACGRQGDLVSQYIRELRTHNASQTVILNSSNISGTVKTGATIAIPSGMREPTTGFIAANMNLSATAFGGCVLSAILLVLIPLLLPFAANNLCINVVLDIVIGFFVASRLQKRLIAPFQAQLENAKSRWRRSKICTRCDVVFVPGESVYTVPELLNRLIWQSPSNG